MSIKSTKYLTRAAAESLYRDYMERLRPPPELPDMTDEELGDYLDELAERVASREGTVCFDNYLITKDGKSD